jgi:LacI family transcriptional regulator
MSITIKDIAKIAGVSHTTVSRALNDSSLISEKTKVKIRKIADEYNYTANTSAKSLKLNRSFNIGIFFTSIKEGTSSDFFHKAIIGANKSIGDEFNLVVKENIKKDYSKINKQKYDGVVLVSQSEDDQELVDHIIKENIPLVVANRKIKNDTISSFLSDDLEGSYTAVKELIKNGHERIGIILGQSGYKSSRIRYEGYERALKESNLKTNQTYVIEGNYTIKSGYDAMKEILSLNEKPTAIFCSNDEMAIGAIKACNEHGVKIPDDLSLIGYDAIEMGLYTTPTLSTVNRHIEEITAMATSHLLDEINGTEVEQSVNYYPVNMILRESIK